MTDKSLSDRLADLQKSAWATVDICDQFQRFVQKPELAAEAEWVPLSAVEANLAEQQREVYRLTAEVVQLRAQLADAEQRLSALRDIWIEAERFF